MASPTPPLLQGYIDSTHTTNLTSFYPPQNLPTPWPLVAASLTISLALSCYGIKGAFRSWAEPGQNGRRGMISRGQRTWLQTFRERRANYRAGAGKPRSRMMRAHPVVHESELEILHKPGEAHTHHALNDDSITRYEPRHHEDADMRHQLSPDDGDDDELTYKPKAEGDDGDDDDDGASKHKSDLYDEVTAHPGKKLDDDDIAMASKHTLTDPFDDSEAATLQDNIQERERPNGPKWEASRVKKVVLISICAYSTLRAATGLTLALAGLLNHTTPPPAPSLLLLLLISIQTPLSNRSLPRLMTLIYTLAALATSLAFLIVSYAPLLSITTIPRYASLALAGGRCPVPASDCHDQTTHWSVLGCANYTYYTDIEDGGADDIPTARFYPPYATHSDVNLGGANALHVVETVIFICATVWLPTVLLHLYEARHLFARPVLSNLLRPAPTPTHTPAPLLPNDPRTARYGGVRKGATCTSVVAILGLLGAVVAAVLALAAHVSQATGSPGHAAVYIDSLGQGVWANFTRDARGVVNATGYAGNATEWNDCFTVGSPTVLETGWGEWRGANGGGLWAWGRVVVGL